VKTMTAPREYTTDECREMFLEHLDFLFAHHMAGHTKKARDAAHMIVFSILCTFDGVSGGSPAFDLLTAPHESDAEYCRSEGDNWYPMGANIADGSLHESWINRCKP